MDRLAAGCPVNHTGGGGSAERSDQRIEVCHPRAASSRRPVVFKDGMRAVDQKAAARGLVLAEHSDHAPLILTSVAGTMMGSIWAFAGCRRTLSVPSWKKRFSVASAPPINATTMSPFWAVSADSTRM